MIDSADRDPAPKRLAMGRSAYASIRSALEGRLAVLEDEKAVTLAMDLDP